MRKKVGEKVGKAKKWRRAMRGAGGGKVTVFCWVIIILAEVAAMPEVIKFGKAYFLVKLIEGVVKQTGYFTVRLKVRGRQPRRS